MPELLTELEAKSRCLASSLADEPSSFGTDEAKKCMATLTALFQNSRIDAETFQRVAAFLGNHSAIRQWAVAHGFIKQPDDALTLAVQEQIGVIDKAKEAAMKEADVKKEQKKQ